MSQHYQRLIFMLELPCLVDVDLPLVAAALIVAKALHPMVMVVASTSHKIQHHPLDLSASFVERLATLLLGATNVLIQH